MKEKVDIFNKYLLSLLFIQLSSDKVGGSKRDKYGRLLAWVWADSTLSQEILTKNGLVEDFYDYGNYKYEDMINAAMKYAQDNNLNIHD